MTTRRELETVLPDSLRAAGKAYFGRPDAARAAAASADNVRRIYEAGIPIAMGTDAGNPAHHGPSVYREMEAMQQAGMPAAAVFASATIGGARAMALEGEIGSACGQGRRRGWWCGERIRRRTSGECAAGSLCGAQRRALREEGVSE